MRSATQTSLTTTPAFVGVLDHRVLTKLMAPALRTGGARADDREALRQPKKTAASS
jgi:hypothetical protein